MNKITRWWDNLSGDKACILTVLGCAFLAGVIVSTLKWFYGMRM